MRRLALSLAWALAIAPTPVARAASPRSFSAVAERVAAALHARPEHPHLLGVATFFARLAHPREARRLQLAVFETHAQPDLEEVAAAALDRGWQRMVETVNRRRHSQSLVYVCAHGHNFDLLVLNRGGDGEVALVRLEIRPDQILAEVDRRRENR
ncbi:MAG TPA: hypothetical protein VNF74_05065 [Terriglobales bacterium]|nr:hypothetical protein [Terriglobales bacterium]